MIEIIPAMDIIDGRCVRLSQGDFARRTVYEADPVETAKGFEAAGLRRLHMVDLDGARAGRVTNLAVLERVAAATLLVIDFSGGIKRDEDLSSVFGAGASIAGIGSVAVKDPQRFAGWSAEYGREKFLLGADVRGRNLAVDGWLTDTEVDLSDFLRKTAPLASAVFVTDVSKDGAMQGPATGLYRELLAAHPGLNLIASGGVRNADDIRELHAAGCSGVIVGKAVYEGVIKPKEFAEFLNPEAEHAR
ncbi:MAG: 1-(5-phosphoribosyl)-5-[(5-phosphoribosylamino)methylideneamino] imidazole-4-carboxamide isomerase [Blastocatellia bacterium]|nr:1-(5-phosphoribosyl)-5-[(5-phosphoribosylamino)methylideneamino] imidazole-4-carboxamide isomerase [Blastocatellia bacterium]